jgi:hypothetical protein
VNEQTQFLANLIDTAKRRLPTAEGAIGLLRTICRKAADAAPEDDLIRMAQFLYDLRMEAARQAIERN